MRLEGIIAAIPTPFYPDETLNLEALESNVKRWNETSLSGYTVLGTTGEFVSLTLDEKKRVLERAREAASREKVFLAGTGAESTFETLALTRFASDLGADYAILVTPHYNRRAFTSKSLVEHYHRVAEASVIPVVVYHIPACTGLTLEPATVARIAEHPNVAGIKDSSGDVLALQETKRLCPEEFAVLTGSAQILLAAFTVGAQGAILADACAAWDEPAELLEALAAGDIDRARGIQMRLARFSRDVVVRYGIPGMKALLDRMGFHGGPPRLPLLSLDSDAAEDVERALGSLRALRDVS
ncbi:MAG TPA: dihydrodipicolinate synthase family protein [Vicinamibacteria bacterium]|jgi:4-hydroxy-2-oxoglutarate aldolase